MKKSELSQWTEIFSEISQQVGSEDFYKSVIATNGNLKNQLLRFFDELFSQWEKIGVPDEKQMSPLVRESFQDLKNQLSLSKDQSSLLEPNQAEQKDVNPHGLPESLLCLKARCEQNHFLVPMESVLEVSSRRKISALPETVQNFEGLITLRGEMIPVLSSQTIFTKNPQNQSDAENSDPFNFLIICRVGENKFALPVFETNNIVEIKSKELQNPHLLNSKGVSSQEFPSLIVENKIYYLVNPEKLVA